jgi:hypothetical protein
MRKEIEAELQRNLQVRIKEEVKICFESMTNSMHQKLLSALLAVTNVKSHTIHSKILNKSEGKELGEMWNKFGKSMGHEQPLVEESMKGKSLHGCDSEQEFGTKQSNDSKDGYFNEERNDDDEFSAVEMPIHDTIEFDSLQRRLSATNDKLYDQILDMENSCLGYEKLAEQALTKNRATRRKENIVSGMELTISIQEPDESDIMQQSTQIDPALIQRLDLDLLAKIEADLQLEFDLRLEIAKLEYRCKVAQERTRLLNTNTKDLSGSIHIVGRIKPTLDSAQRVLTGDNRSNTITLQGKERVNLRGEIRRSDPTTVQFDEVFLEDSDQISVASPAVDSMHHPLDGRHITIVAAGQSSSGKTHSMIGRKGKGQRGVFHKTIHKLFALTDKRDDARFSLKMRIVQFYKDKISDLLDEPQGELSIVKKLEHAKEIELDNPTSTWMKVVAALRRRVIKATPNNPQSSRSHVMIVLSVHGIHGSGKETFGKVTLLDLAGTEKICHRENWTQDLIAESRKIQESIENLGRVLHALANKTHHIPYRGTNLTEALRHSFEKKSCKIFIYACLNPIAEKRTGSLHTLELIQSVGKVQR